MQNYDCGSARRKHVFLWKKMASDLGSEGRGIIYQTKQAFVCDCGEEGYSAFIRSLINDNLFLDCSYIIPSIFKKYPQA